MQKLTKRKDGRYQMGVYIGRNKDGKKQTKKTYGSNMGQENFRIRINTKQIGILTPPS